MAFKKSFLLILPLILASCASPTNSNLNSATTAAAGVKKGDDGWTGFCLNAKPIPWAASNPNAEIAAIKIHNAKGVAHCGW